MALEFIKDDPIESMTGLRPRMRVVAERLSTALKIAPSSSPVLVSGDWGSGKTSLLRAVRDKLQTQPGRKADDPAPTVWFDAWHYEGEAKLLPVLTRCVWEATPEQYRQKDTAKTLFSTVWRCAAALGTRGIPLIATALGVPVLPALLKDVTLDKIGKEIEALGAPPPPPEDPVRKLREGFAEMIHGCWGEEGPVIFIDDLDRCSPDGAVGLIDGIRMLVAGGVDLRCRFVVALDRGVVTQAITAKFEKVRGYDGNRYLEKVFPLEFHVPALGREEAAQVVEGVLAGAFGEAQTELDRRDREVLRTAFANPLFANPRLMKRTFNRFLFTLHFERPTDRAAVLRSQDDDLILAQWIVATERWPRLRRMMRTWRPEEWASFQGSLKDGAETTPDPETAALMLEPGAMAWLRAQGFDQEAVLKRHIAADLRLQGCGF